MIPTFRKWVLDRIPMGRLGTVEEVASAVVFLASPAAALVTGSIAARRRRLDRVVSDTGARRSDRLAALRASDDAFMPRAELGRAASQRQGSTPKRLFAWRYGSADVPRFRRSPISVGLNASSYRAVARPFTCIGRSTSTPDMGPVPVMIAACCGAATKPVGRRVLPARQGPEMLRGDRARIDSRSGQSFAQMPATSRVQAPRKVAALLSRQLELAIIIPLGACENFSADGYQSHPRRLPINRRAMQQAKPGAFSVSAA